MLLKILLWKQRYEAWGPPFRAVTSRREKVATMLSVAETLFDEGGSESGAANMVQKHLKGHRMENFPGEGRLVC